MANRIKTVQVEQVKTETKPVEVVETPAVKKAPVKIEKKKKHKVGYPKGSNLVCVKRKNGDIVRVTREEAAKIVCSKQGTYEKKSEWRKAKKG